MFMIITILLVAAYLTLLNFKRLKKLSKMMKWLLTGLFLIVAGYGSYLFIMDFSLKKAIENLLLPLSFTAIVIGIQYLLKRRRTREKNWSLNDYSIKYRKQHVDKELFKGLNAMILPWEASIKGWHWMSGFGNDREEAYLNLVKRFDTYKSEGNILPTPGAGAPLVLASHDRMDDLEEEAILFFRTIFGWDYNDIFISDESSLYDLCLTDDFMRKQQQIEKVFGIKVSDSKARIVDILELMREKQVKEIIDDVK